MVERRVALCPTLAAGTSIRAAPTTSAIGSMWADVGDHRDVLVRSTPTGEGAAGP